MRLHVWHETGFRATEMHQRSVLRHGQLCFQRCVALRVCMHSCGAAVYVQRCVCFCFSFRLQHRVSCGDSSGLRSRNQVHGQQRDLSWSKIDERAAVPRRHRWRLRLAGAVQQFAVPNYRPSSAEHRHVWTGAGRQQLRGASEMRRRESDLPGSNAAADKRQMPYCDVDLQSRYVLRRRVVSVSQRAERLKLERVPRRRWRL